MAKAETDIVPQAEVVIHLPETSISPKDLMESIKLLDMDSRVLPGLKARALSIPNVIDNAETYAEAGAILTEERLLKESPTNRLGWFDTFLQRARGFYNEHAQKFTNQCTEIESILKPKLKTWEFQERPAAKADVQKTNKARAKEGLPPIVVAPAISKIPGYRASITYKATFDSPEDFDKLLKVWKNTKNKTEWAYLRQFITFNEKKLNGEARDVKNPKDLMKRIPGSRAWSE